MPYICFLPVREIDLCPAECFIKLLFYITLLFIVGFLPLVCKSSCSGAGEGRQPECYFCALPNAIANVVRRLYVWLQGAEESPPPAEARAPKPAPQVTAPEPKKSKKVPKETKTQKKKLCAKISDLFQKCKSKKSKENVCITSCNECKASAKVGKSKSEPKMELQPSDLALSGNCARCVEKKTPCPENCPKAKR